MDRNKHKELRGESVLMTAREVAELLRTSPRAIYAERGKGLLPGGIKLGKRLLFRRATLMQWLLDSECYTGGRVPSPRENGQ